MPWALVGVLVASVMLAAERWFFALALAAQLAFYGLAAIGAWLETRERPRAGRFAGELPVALGEGRR